MSDNYLKDERLYKVLHDRHYDGIGPVDTDEQIPMALRSVSLETCSQTGHTVIQTVDRPKDWYKSMFKVMHKAGRSGYVGDLNSDYEAGNHSLTHFLL